MHKVVYNFLTIFTQDMSRRHSLTTSQFIRVNFVSDKSRRQTCLSGCVNRLFLYSKLSCVAWKSLVELYGRVLDKIDYKQRGRPK